MKLRSIRMMMLSTFALASASLTFAGDQPGKMHMLSKSQMQDRTGMTRAVQYGKGTGMTRSQVVLRWNAYRSETAEDSAALKDNSSAARPNRSDSVLRK